MEAELRRLGLPTDRRSRQELEARLGGRASGLGAIGAAQLEEFRARAVAAQDVKRADAEKGRPRWCPACAALQHGAPAAALRGGGETSSRRACARRTAALRCFALPCVASQ
jgi:hypothetical protein